MGVFLPKYHNHSTHSNVFKSSVPGQVDALTLYAGNLGLISEICLCKWLQVWLRGIFLG